MGRIHLVREDAIEGVLKKRFFDDGTEQWIFDPEQRVSVAAERVVQPDSKRKNWVLVDRGSTQTNKRYPPKIAGPFPTEESAKAALRLIHSGGAR